MVETKKSRRPVGSRVHLTGNQEMGMETEGYGRKVWDVGPLRHMNGIEMALQRGVKGYLYEERRKEERN